jgi:hypothetical protein
VTLPPLPITITPVAPLVAGPPPVQPPLLSHPPVIRRTQAIPPATGRVEGLATVVPRVEEPPPPPVAVSAPEPVRPLVHRKVRSGPPVAREAMVEAVGGYVGEPREPAVPHRAPGWMRHVPEWLSQATTTPEADPVPSAPEPVAKPDFLRPPPEPKRKVLESARPDTVDAERPARPKRRPTLGQTRRLGLGTPLHHRPEEQAEPPAETPEPPPAPPAPVAEVVEATEEPDDEPEAEPPPPRPEPPPLLHPRPTEAVTTPQPEPPARPEPRAQSEPRTRPARTKPTAPPAGQQPSSGAVVNPAAAVPLTYRSAPGRPERRAASPAIPTDLASALRGSHQVDVSAIPVHRGPAVSAEARSLGARAFARGGEVFLPEEAGPLGSPKARGLLAHELVHAVQQRVLGPSLPAMSTADGAALEAEAVAAEHAHGGAPPAPLVHPVLTQVISHAVQAAGVQLAPLVPTPVDFTSPAVVSAPAPVTPEPVSLSEPMREEVDLRSEASATRVVERWSNPALGGTGFALGEDAQPARPPVTPGEDGVPLGTDPGATAPGDAPSPSSNAAEEVMAHQILQVINIDRAAKGQPDLELLDEYTMEQVRLAVAQENGSTGRSMMLTAATSASVESAQQTELEVGRPTVESPAVAQPAPAADRVEQPAPAPAPAPAQSAAEQAEEPYGRDRQLDLDAIDLDVLSARLYDRLRSKIRLELLIDRERAGLLTDFR